MNSKYNQKIDSCPSLTKFTSIAGFFSKKQYAAIAERVGYEVIE
ncbi:hypothetical protein IMSAGC001_02032 [Bacteroides acidifaciens]|jgi:hypothetical protein|uniref:Uncharacterized protein n=1 Tax=Bacteroides acidifaciens TaxID=85831 RepID=A0A7J0A3A8_9BACE|nr:hypothetical protein IMSAGC001_02032 [Bacteroides acidifaciens]